MIAIEIEDDLTPKEGLVIYAAHRRDHTLGPAGRWLLDTLPRQLRLQCVDFVIFRPGVQLPGEDVLHQEEAIPEGCLAQFFAEELVAVMVLRFDHPDVADLGQDTIVEQLFREVRAFRIYDGPTEVHKWSLAKKIKKAELARQSSAD